MECVAKSSYDARAPFDTTTPALDYPPFFAYFEWILSIPASFIDPGIVDLNNLNYGAWSVVVYQRTTVILSELVLAAALIRFVRGAVDPPTQRILSASLFLHPGFLIIDHIHFQYNGFLFGILLFSILMARNGNQLGSGILFAVLLNFKHIYMYIAPAYFIYLLRGYCMAPHGQILPTRFVSLANGVIFVFVVSLGPFIFLGQLPQLFSRLFPFTRGLNHAYWAPNAWALLTAIDRVLLQYTKKYGGSFALNDSGVTSTSRGLVGDTVFAVVPNIKPIHTFLITVAFQSIFLLKLWRKPTYKAFLTVLTLCGYTSYLFGWHVHEKAILLVLVPLSLLAADSHAFFRTFVIASVAEHAVEIIYSTLWAILVFIPLHKRVYEFPRSLSGVIVNTLELLYLGGFVLLQAFVILMPALLKTFYGTDEGAAAKWEFLPLMLTSIYCAVGLVWAYIRLSFLFLTT
ncbi:hypothetical protein EVG20_g264 [Dentipellis fragilis]|uniref:Alpha-1,3-glucosyltransferase n=1 Tax=Dentipellis fragilis TaxID=205917 RepID=A0A4Y9ZDU8_9AGAM|nr:hypothetical protein EVG20_g264 [Dentipellis fragilis]